MSSDEIENLKNMINAAVNRLDDLRNAEIYRVNDQMKLTAEYNIKLNVAEAKRIDAIRSVDVNAVSVANEKAAAQAIVLANQVTQSAENLRSLVASTAMAQAQQLSTLTTQLTDRLSSLEKSQYEKSGSSGGMQSMWGYVFGIGMALITIGIGLYAVFNK